MMIDDESVSEEMFNENYTKSIESNFVLFNICDMCS